jgi:hypothetical protein
LSKKNPAELGGVVFVVSVDHFMLIELDLFVAAGTAIVAQTIPFIPPLGPAGARVVFAIPGHS